ncbi:MAG: FAD-dependent oxidoreductase [Clostridia bacterium]|nr:FAD-dependent oxidoreductase [Clostridia bacterium]
MYDVIIIGGGVCGAAIAMYLSKYDVKCCLLEKDNDIAIGTTRANSGIVHAGYDPEPDTLMARLNVRGCELIEEIASKMNVPYRKTGSMVIAFNANDEAHIRELYERGIANGVRGMELLDKEELLKREPNLSPDVTGALYAPSAAVVNPWRLCLAMAETAAKNGVEICLDSEVTAIEKINGTFRITAGGRELDTKYIINAAGLYSDRIAELVGAKDFTISPSKGQYYLLDKTSDWLVNSVIFQCPTEKGKGVLVSPTAEGNIIVGPNAESGNERDDVSTTREGLDFVAAEAAKTTKLIDYRENIRSFAGLRANSDKKDFIIGESALCRHFINVAGIKSPGLSSAPAIGEYVIEILEDCGMLLSEKSSWDFAEPHVCFAELSNEEKAEICKRNPKYGNVICRCNLITEGEILDAFNSHIKPRTLDAIKRRTGSGMGRCQGGFCGSKIHELICSYYGIPAEKVLWDKNGSYIVAGKVGADND